MITKFRKSKKEGADSIFFSILLGVLVVAVIGFLVFSNLKISQKRTRLSSQIESLKAQIQSLEQKKEELQLRIGQQGSEEYLEEIARENLNLKKPGEKVVAITQEEEPEAKNQEKNFFDKLLDKIRTYFQ